MSDYKKIIFLDIDGVLASIPYLCKAKEGPFRFIDPKKCKLLNQLGEIDAEIVISSSWGYDEGRTEKSLRECGLTLPIVGYTDHSVHYNYDWACRGNEIEKWLMDNNFNNTKWGGDYYLHTYDKYIDYEYVIFDDDEDILYGQKDHFIHTNQQTGLTQRDINKAIKLLTRDETQK